MFIIIFTIAGLYGAISSAYFLLLMADAKKLEKRLADCSIDAGRDMQDVERPLFKLDHILWTAPLACRKPLVHTTGNAELPE